MTSHWQPFHEPLRTTLTRTVTIAIVAGAIVARSLGGLSRWPLGTLLMLWPSFGGHWVDLYFLNWLRPRLPRAREVQMPARLVVWFAGGCLLGVGMAYTALLVAGMPLGRWPAWWVAGVAFIGIELVVHLAFQLRGRPSFYNGRS